jgi:shikimate dehydrogenase
MENPVLFSDLTERAGFSHSPEQLALLQVPTHLIVSGNLRLSRTFEIYRRAFAELKLPDVYIPHELPPIGGQPDMEGLRALLTVFRSSPMMKTLVISDPFKQAVVPMLSDTEPLARQIGAVNVVKKRGDRLVGDNLDGSAFVLGVQQELGYAFRRVSAAFFGCGGVSTAVATKLAPDMKRAALIDIRLERAEYLAHLLKQFNPKIKTEVFDRSSELDLRRYEVFYNGTGLGKDGQHENAFLLTPLHAFDLLPEEGLAFDANYTPWETAFLRRFDVMDFTTLNGFSHMLGFTSLHLSLITGMPISYEFIRELSQFAVPSPASPHFTPWQ